MRARNGSLISVLLVVVSEFLVGCSGSSFISSQAPTPPAQASVPAPIVLTASPSTVVSLLASQSVQLSATNGGAPESMSWRFLAGSPSEGSLTDGGLFTAPVEVSADNVSIVGSSLTHPGVDVTIQVTLSNPSPTASSILPSTAARNMPYTGTLNGAMFTPGSRVVVNGQAVTSSFLSSNSLQFSIGIPEPNASQINVQVVNPQPGGGTTQTLVVPVGSGEISYDAATRFLKQASWGPTPSSIAQVQQLGFAAYIDAQIALPTDSLVIDDNFMHVYENLWANGLAKPSQIRQKMMWTWYKMFNTPGSTDEAWLSASPEQLQRDALSSFRTLLLDASMESSNCIALNFCPSYPGPSPNQNFGREIMQLFSVGPITLNQDGTPVLNSDGTVVPTYSQTDVSEMARAMTGWNQSPLYDGGTDTEGISPIMVSLNPRDHDDGSKAILGTTIPAGGDAASDLNTIVTMLARHPNTAPFMSLRLIRAFVTSNPSPMYVSRISGVWQNDGTGAHGNLAAVIKAILLDPEARAGDDPTSPLDSAEGRVMDSIEYQMSVNRILGTQLGAVSVSRTTAAELNEFPFSAPSVFGYYTASYQLPGTSVYAPELSLFTTSALQAKASYLYQIIHGGAAANLYIDWSSWSALAVGDGSPLVNQINHTCLNGRMSPGLNAVLHQAFAEVPPDANNSQAQRLLYLTLMSPEFAVIR